MSDLRTDISTAASDDTAVWVLAEADADGENLNPIRAGDVMYAPGTQVVFGEEHEMYPGEEGIVHAVGMGKGTYSGPTYDVLPDGCSDAERVSEFGIEDA